MNKLFLFISIVFASICQDGFSQTYFTDPLNGNDNNKGSSKEPFATLEKAVKEANESTGTGQITIKLFPGLYVLQDKLILNPVRVINDTTKYTIEAVVMPDDTSWTAYKMPIIQSISTNNSATQFPHATGILVASDNVVIRGLKFIGNPKSFSGSPNLKTYYYPISKENEKLKHLEVSQCLFIAEKNSAPIQGGIWAHGPETNVNNCVFYNCRNAILLFKSVEGFSITNSIIYGAYQSAIWMGPIQSNFVFKNNVITKCDYFWVRPENTSPKYQFSDCLISENNHYTGFYTNVGLIETSSNKNFKEMNVIKQGKVNLIEVNGDVLPDNILHLKPESVGYSLKAGIFKKDK